jgi:hypothetical protein
VAVAGWRAYSSSWSIGLNEHGHPDGDRQETALAQRRGIETWRDPEWQRLCLTVEHRQWRSLAVIPGGEGAPLEFALNIAVALSRTGMSHMGAPIQVADGSQVALNQLNGFIADVRHCTEHGARLIMALPPVINSTTAVSIAKSADAAVLCVLMGTMRSSQARQTIKLVGAAMFIGSIIIRPESLAPPPP